MEWNLSYVNTELDLIFYLIIPVSAIKIVEVDFLKIFN